MCYETQAQATNTWLQLGSRISIFYRNNDASLSLSSGINALKTFVDS